MVYACVCHIRAGGSWIDWIWSWLVQNPVCDLDSEQPVDDLQLIPSHPPHPPKDATIVAPGITTSNKKRTEHNKGHRGPNGAFGREPNVAPWSMADRMAPRWLDPRWHGATWSVCGLC